MARLILFEETGEVRHPRPGEFWTRPSDGAAMYAYKTVRLDRHILTRHEFDSVEELVVWAIESEGMHPEKIKDMCNDYLQNVKFPVYPTPSAHAERRERIATVALAGMLASPSKFSTWDDKPMNRGLHYVHGAVGMADLLIAELDKDGGE